MSTVLAYAIIIPLVVACFVAAFLLIWDLWHLPVIYVEDGE